MSVVQERGTPRAARNERIALQKRVTFFVAAVPETRTSKLLFASETAVVLDSVQSAQTESEEQGSEEITDVVLLCKQTSRDATSEKVNLHAYMLPFPLTLSSSSDVIRRVLSRPIPRENGI